MVKNNTPFLGGPPGMATQGRYRPAPVHSLCDRTWAALPPRPPETTLPTVPAVPPGRYRHISK